MTIRRKLTLSFGFILALFGINLGIYYWSSAQRNQTVNTLGRAIERQSLIAAISQKLNILHKQIALLGTISMGSGGGAASPQEIQQFAAQLSNITAKVDELSKLADPSERQQIAAFKTEFEKLGASWKTYYEDLDVKQELAVMELAMHGDPLTEQVFEHLLPQLKKTEDLRVSRAKENFARVTHITARVSTAIFLLTLLVAFFVVIRVWRDMTIAVSELMSGADAWADGLLGRRLKVRDDEFGQLSVRLNQMAESLSVAQEKLKVRTEELEQTNRQLAGKNREIEKQKQVSDDLLLNILPAAIAEELHSKGSVSPKYYEDVTILFTDFVGFTRSSETLPVEELVRLLNGLFTTFDKIVKKYGLEKLKTIGDAYMCAGGIPSKNSSHPVDAVLSAFEIVEAVTACNQLVHCPWSIRIGIHTGPVAAGVVGINKFAFDVWGDTVNFASRLESTGAPNRINVSATTYSRIKDFFDCEFRGRIETKEKKAFDMFFVNGLRPDLRNAEGATDPSAFAQRYGIYFSKLPPAVPMGVLTYPAKI